MNTQTLCLLIAIGLLGCSTAFGQSADDSASDLRYWVHAGPSITTLGSGMHGGLAVEFDRHVLSLRATSTEPAFGDETWDVALLYGRAMVIRPFVLSGGTGVSVVGGTRYGGFFGGGPGRSLDPMIGFPLEGQIAWRPTAVVAIGLYGFANVNTGQPFGGMGMTLRVGNLR